jgi:hypothetical protein
VRIVVSLDGVRMLDEPFQVGGQTGNRPPAPAQPHVSRTGDGVWLCALDVDLLHADPDYDVVSYRYVWRIGPRVVRSVRAAGLQDVLPRTTAGAPTCSVTPSDGTLTGPTLSS